MSYLGKELRKQEFYPKTLGLLFNPAYFARRGLVSNIQKLAKNFHGRILDIGCGTKPYKNLFSFTEYIGLEIDSPENRKNKEADAFYDGKGLPFKNNEFDGIFMSEVLEHVFEPQEMLTEAHRVLKPGGQILLTVPFIWVEHEQPYDYGRYSSFGLKYLLEKNGFEIITQEKSVTGIVALFQILNSYTRKNLRGMRRHTKLLLYLLLIAPVNIIGTIAGVLFPPDRDLYLDNIVLAKKVK